MEGVGATALLTAAARALETERAGGLLSDPMARSMAGEEGFDLLALGATGPVAVNGTPLYVLRHRFFDDLLIELTSSGLRQVVLVAAGFDTRAFRLDWPPDTQLFEIDQFAVFAHKETVIDGHRSTPGCARHLVAADLRENWPELLLSAGFDPERPTAWVAEGLLFYLPEPSLHRLIDDLYRLSAPGSCLATDMMGAARGPPQAFRDLFARLGAPFLFTTDDPAGLLRSHNWDATSIPFGEVARRLGTELTAGGQVVIAHR
jgi:methyltransferase (TIGR00027 family)